MHDFKYKNNILHCEDISLERIAEEVGTPAYVYSYNTLRNHFRVFDKAFKEIPHLICFSVKANSNLAILRLFAKEGGGADIVSGGELYRALKAGIKPDKIVYAGVGKTRDEIAFALRKGILMFNVESNQELVLINTVAKEMGKRARVALRVTPEIDPVTHPYITTGLKKDKFGISIHKAIGEYRFAATLSNIDVVGIHKHIGSQLTEVHPFVEALKKIVTLVEELEGIGIDIRYINVGGGLGITYNEEEPPHPEELADALVPLIKGTGCTIIFEPGRVIVGNAGILLTKVLYTKEGDGKRFIIVDAGMNDLIRPSLYKAYHEIVPVVKKSREKILSDVVGPICESGDFLAKGRMLPEMRPDEILSVMSAGAYGFTMSSNYNSRRRVAEVIVRGREYHLIRRREEYRDLIKGEMIPDFLRRARKRD